MIDPRVVRSKENVVHAEDEAGEDEDAGRHDALESNAFRFRWQEAGRKTYLLF